MGAERVLMAARREEGVGMGEEVRGLRGTEQPWDVQHRIGNGDQEPIRDPWT